MLNSLRVRVVTLMSSAVIAAGMLGVPEPPQQWLALVHERWGLRERVPIVLEDPKTATRPRIRVPAGMVVS